MTALMTACVIAGLLVARALVRRNRMSPTAAGLMIGGAAANTVDRAGTAQLRTIS